METRIQDTAEGRRVDYINNHGVKTVPLDKNYSTILKALDQDGNCILQRIWTATESLLSLPQAMPHFYKIRYRWAYSCSHISEFRRKTCIYPRSRPCIPFSSSKNCINALPYSESLMTKIFSEGLLPLPIPSIPPSIPYRVTSSTLHMIRIFSLTRFVFFFFQSLMPLRAIPVFSENSFWLIPKILLTSTQKLPSHHSLPCLFTNKV